VHHTHDLTQLTSYQVGILEVPWKKILWMRPHPVVRLEQFFKEVLQDFTFNQSVG